MENLLIKFGKAKQNNDPDFEEWQRGPIPVWEMFYNRAKLLVRLTLLLDQKIDKIVDRIAKIQGNKYPGIYERTFKNTKIFFLDLLNKNQAKQIKAIFEPFER
jgi:hypothetical protein